MMGWYFGGGDDKSSKKKKALDVTIENVNKQKKSLEGCGFLDELTIVSGNKVYQLEDKSPGKNIKSHVKIYSQRYSIKEKSVNVSALKKPMLYLDNKVYELYKLEDFLKTYEKRNAFKPGFFNELKKECKGKNPEELSDYIGANKDKVHPDAYYHIKNKIWHSERSDEIWLKGVWYVPMYKEMDPLKVKRKKK